MYTLEQKIVIVFFLIFAIAVLYGVAFYDIISLELKGGVKTVIDLIFKFDKLFS